MFSFHSFHWNQLCFFKHFRNWIFCCVMSWIIKSCLEVKFKENYQTKSRLGIEISACIETNGHTKTVSMIALWFKNVKLLLQNINTSLYFSLKILNANWSVESSTSKSQQSCFCILIMTIDNSKLVNDLHVIIVVRIIFGLSKFFSNYHKWNECYPWTQSCSWKYTD